MQTCCCCLVAQSCLTLCNPHGPQPTRLLCPWDFSGKNTGVGCHLLLQGTFLTQEDPESPALAGRFFTTEPPGKPHLWVRQTLILVTRSMEMISMPLSEMLYHFIFPFHPESYHKGKKQD